MGFNSSEIRKGKVRLILYWTKLLVEAYFFLEGPLTFKFCWILSTIFPVCIISILSNNLLFVCKIFFKLCLHAIVFNLFFKLGHTVLYKIKQCDQFIRGTWRTLIIFAEFDLCFTNKLRWGVSSNSCIWCIKCVLCGVRDYDINIQRRMAVILMSLITIKNQVRKGSFRCKSSFS